MSFSLRRPTNLSIQPPPQYAQQQQQQQQAQPSPVRSRGSFGSGGPGGVPSDRASGAGGFAGAYDNKLVTSTLSQLPSVQQPLSPSHTGTSHFSQHSGSTSRLQQHLQSLRPERPGLAGPAAAAAAASSSQSIHSSSNISSLEHKESHSSFSSRLHLSRPRPSISIHSPTTATPNGSFQGNGKNGDGKPESIVVLPDGTVISDHGTGGKVVEHKSIFETLLHSSAGSHWSMLSVYALRLFSGQTLQRSVEELNAAANSHIIATSQRVAVSKILAVLASDLRDFIATGMVTLHNNFNNIDEGRLISKAAEEWTLFWIHVLPYIEGIFLPFTQLRDQQYSNTPAIPVRHLVLSGYLIHILLPLLPRLIPIIALADEEMPVNASMPQVEPTIPDLKKLLQMSLVLSTQGRYSSFFPLNDEEANIERDTEVRDNVEALGKAARWRLGFIERSQSSDSLPTAQGGPSRRQSTLKGDSNEPSKGGGIGLGAPPTPRDGTFNAGRRHSIARGHSISLGQAPSGRYRRRGWRASDHLSGMNSPITPTDPHRRDRDRDREQDFDPAPTLNSRHNSEFHPPPTWAARVDEHEDEDEAEDDSATPGQNYTFPPRRESAATATTATITPGTGGGASLFSSTASTFNPETHNHSHVHGHGHHLARAIFRGAAGGRGKERDWDEQKTPQAGSTSTGLGSGAHRASRGEEEENDATPVPAIDRRSNRI